MKRFPRTDEGKLDLKAFLLLSKDEQQLAETELNQQGSFRDKLMFSQMQKAIADDRQRQDQDKDARPQVEKVKGKRP